MHDPHTQELPQVPEAPDAPATANDPTPAAAPAPAQDPAQDPAPASTTPTAATPAAGQLVRQGVAMTATGLALAVKSAVARPAKAARARQGAPTRDGVRPIAGTGPVPAATAALTPMPKRLERVAIAVAIVAALCLTVLAGPLHQLGNYIKDATSPQVSVVYPPAPEPVTTTQAVKPGSARKKNAVGQRAGHQADRKHDAAGKATHRQ